MKKLLSIISFFRPINLFMVFAMFWGYEYLLLEPLFAKNGLGLHLSDLQLDLLALDTVIVALSGYWINDWYDRSIDAINRPNRLLVRYDVSAALFFTLYGVLMLIGLAISVFLAVQLDYVRFVWIYPVFVVAMWFYAARVKSKGFAGNVLVSLAIATIPWLILLAEKPVVEFLYTNSLDSFAVLIWHITLISSLMFVSNLVREMIKDGEDVAGDLQHNSGSLLASIGPKKLKLVMQVSILLMMGFETYLVVMSSWITEIFIHLTLIVALVLIVVLVKSFKISEKKHYSQLNFLMKLVMLLGMIQIAALSPS